MKRIHLANKSGGRSRCRYTSRPSISATFVPLDDFRKLPMEVRCSECQAIAETVPTQGADARPVASELGWTGNTEIDAALIMLDRLDVQSDDDTRVDAISATLRRLATLDAAPSENEQRYLWLREQQWNESKLAVVCDPKKSVKLGYDCPNGQRLDEIIDAARTAIAPREAT